MSRQKNFRIAVRRFDAFEDAIARQWASFETEAHTGLTLEAVPLDLHPLEEALFTSSGMKNGAWDVCFVATDWIAAMHRSGAALDLAPLFAADPVPDFPTAWTDSLLRLQRIDNAILGTPYHDGPECLIYRKDLFNDPANQAVYEHRFGQPLAPPKTWAEFHQIARFLHNPDESHYGAIFASFPDGHNTVYDFLLQLWTRGGDLFTSTGNLRFNTPQAAEALAFYRSILTDTAAIHPHCQQLDSVKAGLAFAAGEAAMMVNWFGFAAMAHTAADSKVKGLIDIAEIPHGRNGNPISLNVYWILSIAAGSPHPEIAWRFLKHCLTPAMDKLTTTAGAIGCRKSTWSDPDVNHAIPFYHRMEALHQVAREIPQLDTWPQIATIIDTLITATITTSQPIETLLTEADRKAHDLIQSGSE
jgi:multiple sugar transport system substrate-binding protein